ncbi:MAG: ATP synthase F1 subunit delta [Thermodesulfobacteriota bacterium]
MPRISSLKRYAQAAFELAVERNELESWQKGLEKIAELTKNEGLMAFIQNPRIPFETKKRALEYQLGEILPLTLNLALLLVNKGLLRMGPRILQQFQLLLDVHFGLERAKVKSAVPLDAHEKDILSRRLEEISKRKVLIEGEVDPTLLGGFVARIGDKIIDASLRHQLEALRQHLLQASR